MRAAEVNVGAVVLRREVLPRQRGPAQLPVLAGQRVEVPGLLGMRPPETLEPHRHQVVRVLLLQVLCHLVGPRLRKNLGVEAKESREFYTPSCKCKRLGKFSLA